MANTTQTAVKPLTEADVKNMIERGEFSLEKLLESLVGQKAYVRAGSAYRELLKENGAAYIGGAYAICYRLGKRINVDGAEVAARPRKKKS